jgi:hypothetical protein
MSMTGRFARHRGAAVTLAVAVVAAVAFGIYWFAPQRLFIDQRVSETLPSGPAVLAEGDFRSLEHESSGRALVLRLPDGRRFLRLEDLDTSSGPDLRVYLSAAAATSGPTEFGREFVDLGALKGNQGDQNYEIPAGVGRPVRERRRLVSPLRRGVRGCADRVVPQYRAPRTERRSRAARRPALRPRAGTP